MNKRIVVIDIGSEAIKLAICRTVAGWPAKGDAIVEQWITLPSANLFDSSLCYVGNQAADESRGLAPIREWIKSNHAIGCPAVIIAPSRSIFHRFVKLPPVDESKVGQIIQYEAQQNVPYPIEDTSWNFSLLGSTDQGEVEVQIVAMRNAIVELLMAFTKACGLKFLGVTPSTCVLANLVTSCLESTLLINLGNRSTDLVFSDRYSRTIPLGRRSIDYNTLEEVTDSSAGTKVDQLENFFRRLNAEIVRTINFYIHQQNGMDPAHVIVCGSPDVTEKFIAWFKAKFPDKTVDGYGDPASVGIPELPVINAAILAPLEIQLTPLSVKDKAAKRKHLCKVVPAIVGALAVGAIGLYFVCQHSTPAAVHSEPTVEDRQPSPAEIHYRTTPQKSPYITVPLGDLEPGEAFWFQENPFTVLTSADDDGNVGTYNGSTALKMSIKIKVKVDTRQVPRLAEK